MRKLWPPLADISRLLSPPEAALADPLAAAEDRALDDIPAPPMPAHIAELIQRQVATRDAFPVQSPAAGLLIRLDELPARAGPWPFTGALAMLLDQQDLAGCWHGWLAVGETDYATAADVLLEPTDGPFDPSGGLIQTWNPVRLRLGEAVKPLGRVDAARLGAMRSLAGQLGEAGFNPASAHPGRMQVHDRAGIQLLCGTPLGNPADPRWAYRALYATAASRLQDAWQESVAPAKAPPVARSAWPKWLAFVFRPGFSVAMTVMVAVSALLNVSLMRERGGEPEEYARYRSAAAPAKRVPEVEIRLRDDARAKDVRALLLEIRGEIAGGPSQLGIYRIALPEGNVSAAVATLRAANIVEWVSPPAGQP